MQLGRCNFPCRFPTRSKKGEIFFIFIYFIRRNSLQFRGRRISCLTGLLGLTGLPVLVVYLDRRLRGHVSCHVSECRRRHTSSPFPQVGLSPPVTGVGTAGTESGLSRIPSALRPSPRDRCVEEGLEVDGEGVRSARFCSERSTSSSTTISVEVCLYLHRKRINTGWNVFCCRTLFSGRKGHHYSLYRILSVSPS